MEDVFSSWLTEGPQKGKGFLLFVVLTCPAPSVYFQNSVIERDLH